MSDISDFDSDDSVRDPDFLCEEDLPRFSNFFSETSKDLLKSDELNGVNTIIFSDDFFKIVEMVI